MKIFHPLLCYYPSQAGGPANTLYWLNSNLVKSNYRIQVLSTFFGLRLDKNNHGVSKSCYGEGHNVQFINSKGGSYIKKGIKIIQEIDLIQFSSLFFPPTLPLLILALGKKKKVIISPRGELYPSALCIKPFQKKIWLKAIKIFQNQIFFHATSDYEKEVIFQIFPSAKGVEVIPNFIALPKKLHFKVDRNQFLFIGRINPIKNIDLLLESVAILKNESNPDIKLLIAGEARLQYEKEYYAQLKHLILKLDIEANIVFLGHIENDEKQKLLASSSALILPSKSENFGNVVIEALAQGTPVIASQNTPWEILELTGAGIWVNAKPDKLVDAIETLYKFNNEEYNMMRRRAYELCIQKFEISSNIPHWENFYNKINN